MSETTKATDHCTVEDLGIEIIGDDVPPIIATVNEYLVHFAKPVKPENGGGMMAGSKDCICCGERLDGILGTFTWTVVNGEGKCSKCGWPARALHEIEDVDVPIFNRRIPLILQYHPDQVQKHKP